MTICFMCSGVSKSSTDHQIETVTILPHYLFEILEGELVAYFVPAVPLVEFLHGVVR